MIKRNQIRLNRLNALSDGVLLIMSYIFSSWLWLDVVKENGTNMADVENLRGVPLAIVLMCAGGTVLLLALLSVYRTSRFHGRGWRYGTIVMGNTIAVAAMATALYLFRLEDFSRGVLGLYYITSTLAMLGKRVVALFCLRSIRARGYNLKHVLVIGGGALAEQYIRCAKEQPSLGVRVDRHLIPGKTMLRTLETSLYGTGIDEVVLALDVNELGVTMDVIHVCEKSGTKLSVVPFYNDVIPTNPKVDAVGSVKLIRLRTTPLDEPAGAFFKRAMDLVGSALLLLILSPLFLAIAAAIKLSSPGPVIFRQKRVGLNKKAFTMYKFRSMRVNDKQDSAWSTKTDDRRTWIGAILRKTSLDELPQLWNVLLGDMSLVGPRPEIPKFVDQFRETVPLYMVKYQVRPGMTGWAQINGLRGDTSIPDRVKHDLWYIENWSLWLDIKILFKTAFGGMINDEKLTKTGV